MMNEKLEGVRTIFASEDQNVEIQAKIGYEGYGGEQRGSESEGRECVEEIHRVEKFGHVSVSECSWWW